LQSTRQLDRQNFQTIERRLGDERRQKQNLESQLTNERKFRKLAEEKVARAECSEACKLKSKQMELELNKLRRELTVSMDAKHNAEKQSRSFEHEVSGGRGQKYAKVKQESAPMYFIGVFRAK
jgi:Macoilin family